MNKLDRANLEPNVKEDGFKGTGASFVFEATSSSEDRQCKRGNMKWKRVARTHLGKILMKDKWDNKVSLA